MKTTQQRAQEVQAVTYCGAWQGVGEMYNVKVENGYTTIIVKPGEDVKQRSVETKEKFAVQE
jgi:hypothetical protein